MDCSLVLSGYWVPGSGLGFLCHSRALFTDPAHSALGAVVTLGVVGGLHIALLPCRLETEALAEPTQRVK